VFTTSAQYQRPFTKVSFKFSRPRLSTHTLPVESEHEGERTRESRGS